MIVDVLGDLLPSGLAVALSPFPVVAVVLILGTPRARANGAAFALGWLIGLTAVSAVVLAVAGGADDADSASATVVALARIAVGAGLFVLAARKWRGRPRPGDDPEPPPWMDSIATVEPRRALVLGLGLSGANPKNLALSANAVASVAAAGLDGTDAVWAVAVFVAIGSLTVVGAVVAFLIDAERAARPLASIQRFMSANATVIVMIVLVLLGASMIGDGLAAL
ncbi:MAG TPA: GAP family protein [Acidimicrobiales bacterium]|nr:GAP family protein [Acidimicrobiales bacterium]